MKKLLTLLCGAFLSAPVLAADLTVYTYDSFVSEWGPGPKLEQAFEAKCQCDVKFIAAEDGVSILNRLRIEGKKNKADIILGIDDALMEEARKTDLLQEHGQDVSKLDPAIKWSDSVFLPYDYGYFSFVYDSDKVKEPASSLKELIASDAKIIYQDPRTSTPGQGLMLWVKAVYGDESATAWKQLASHTVTVTKGWWEAYSMFLKGGADYVLSYSTSPAYHIVAEQKQNYKAALFSEGHIAQVELAAITRTSKQPALARQFMQFLISPQAQEILPVSNWMLPVLPNTALPPAFSNLIQPQRIGFTTEEVAKQRKTWLKEWRTAASQ